MKEIIVNNPNAKVISVLQNVIKTMAVHSDKYGITPAKFNTLIKTYNILDNFDNKKFAGYIDVSANTYLIGGSLDYSSFTIYAGCIEVYNGYIQYANGDCDDSSWTKIYSSNDTDHRKRLEEELQCWAESFLLHLDENPARALLVIDKTDIEPAGDRSDGTPF
jgi:hypothetical protein